MYRLTTSSAMRVGSSSASSQSVLEGASSLSAASYEQFNELRGYLVANSKREHRLCGNSEGWGPLSPYRYDFTPCFMDVWVSSVAVGGILCGAVAVWWLLYRRKSQEVRKDWHFWTKQVLHHPSPAWARLGLQVRMLIGIH